MLHSTLQDSEYSAGRKRKHRATAVAVRGCQIELVHTTFRVHCAHVPSLNRIIEWPHELSDIGKHTRETSAFLREEVVDVPGAMQDTDHVRAFGMGKVEDQVAFKAMDREAAQAFKLGHS